MIAVVRSEEELEALVPRWQALWRQRPDASPFLSPAWLMPWWHCFGTGEPRVACSLATDSCPTALPKAGHTEQGDMRVRTGLPDGLMQQAGLSGLLALYVLDDEHGRRLLPMGVGLTDNLDSLGAEPETLLAALLAEDESCDLPDLAPDALLAAAAAPSGWSETRWIGDPCPVLVLPDRFDTLLASLSRGTRRYWQQAVLRAGSTVLVERAGRDIAVCEALEVLFALHARRWADRDEPGVLADPRVRAFHHEAAPKLLADGSLRLEVLHLDGRPAAAHLSLLARGRLLHYLTGFDPEFEAMRPGTLLLGHIIAEAIDEGRGELHFLRGSEGYKYAWGGVDRTNVGRRLRRGSC